MTIQRRTGFGTTLDWDSTGAVTPTYVTLASVVDGGKLGDAKKKMADVTLLSETFHTYSGCSIEPGSYSFTLNYDPLNSEYHALNASFKAVNSQPAWRISFPADGNGSGATTETFRGPIESIGREIMKDKYCECTIVIQICGDPGLTAA